MTTQQDVGIERTTLIDAPLEKVFAYYADPRNFPEIWPSLLEVKDVQTGDDGHLKSFRWVYKMAGMRFSGSTQVTQFIPNERAATHSKEGIESRFDVSYTDKGGKTEVHERVQYRIPIPLIGRVAERFLRKTNENELEVIHANLKARMESAAS